METKTNPIRLKIKSEKLMFLIIMFFGLTLSINASGQCDCDAPDYGNIDVSGWSIGQTEVQELVFAGERVTISNTVAGAVYRISTCGASYNSQLTIYTTNCLFLGYNNGNGPDCNGNRASIDITSPGGDLFAKVNRFNCNANTTFTNVYITLIALPDYSFSVTSFDFGSSEWCEGDTKTVTATIENTGAATWYASGATTCPAPDNNNQVAISYKWNGDPWYDSYSNNRNPLPYDIAPGESVVITIDVQSPVNDPPGLNNLSINLIAQECHWFTSVHTVEGINIIPSPTNVSAGTDATICFGNSIQLNGSANSAIEVELLEIFESGLFDTNWNADEEWKLKDGNFLPYNTTNIAAIDWTYSVQDEWLITPVLEFPLGEGNLSFKSMFMGANHDSFSWEEHDYIKISTDGGSTWTTISDLPYDNPDFDWDSENWETFNYNLNPYLSPGDDNVRIAFHRETPDGGSARWGLDNIYVSALNNPVFTWSPSTSLSDPNIHNPIATPSTTTTYTMTASFNGCSVQDDVAIDFYDGSWTGIEDQNWHNSNNWCNDIPTSTDDVVISSNAINMPEIHFNNATANNLTILSGASLGINNNQNLQLHGHFVNSGNFSMANGNETLILVGNNTNLSTNDQPVQHLSIELASARVLLQNNLQIEGNLTISDGELVTGAHNIDISGNISINGSLDATGSNVSLNGNNQQNLNTNGNNAVFYELTINNNSGLLDAIVLESDLHIAGHLQLNQGIIDGTIAPYKVKLLNGATANAGNTNSFVNGEVERTGTTAFVYPIGDVANIGGSDRAIWAPIETDACDLSTISANYYYENPPYDWWYHNENMDATIDHVSDREYWDLSTDNATPAVTIYWTDNMDDLHSFGATSGEMTSTFLANNLTIAHYNTTLGKWDDMGANIPTGPIYFNDGKIKTTNVFSSYSPITFASKNPDFTLPVELKNFTAICKDDYVEINWTSATEINNEYFLLERMQNNSNWEFVAEIPGAGNSNTEINYQIVDEQLNSETSYYRLTQFDFDGKFEIFKIISIHCKNSKDNAEITIFPNPFTNNINLIGSNWNSDEAIRFQITDMSGRLLKTYDLHSQLSNFQTVFYLGDLSSGMYMLEIFSKDYYKHFKIQKQ
jgi:hypothetical protein